MQAHTRCCFLTFIRNSARTTAETSLMTTRTSCKRSKSLSHFQSMSEERNANHVAPLCEFSKVLISQEFSRFLAWEFLRIPAWFLNHFSTEYSQSISWLRILKSSQSRILKNSWLRSYCTVIIHSLPVLSLSIPFHVREQTCTYSDRYRHTHNSLIANEMNTCTYDDHCG